MIHIPWKNHRPIVENDREGRRRKLETEHPITEEDRTTETEVLRPEPEERPVIRARCDLYACRVCRTKTGWPHQKWCAIKPVTEPDCGDCRYWSVRKNRCDHPASRRGGDRR